MFRRIQILVVVAAMTSAGCVWKVFNPPVTGVADASRPAPDGSTMGSTDAEWVGGDATASADSAAPPARDAQTCPPSCADGSTARTDGGVSDAFPQSPDGGVMGADAVAPRDAGAVDARPSADSSAPPDTFVPQDAFPPPMDAEPVVPDSEGGVPNGDTDSNFINDASRVDDTGGLDEDPEGGAGDAAQPDATESDPDAGVEPDAGAGDDASADDDASAGDDGAVEPDAGVEADGAVEPDASADDAAVDPEASAGDDASADDADPAD